MDNKYVFEWLHGYWFRTIIWKTEINGLTFCKKKQFKLKIEINFQHINGP